MAGIHLQAGWHPVRLTYVHDSGRKPELSLEWSGPGWTREAIPQAHWGRTQPPEGAP